MRPDRGARTDRGGDFVKIELHLPVPKMEARPQKSKKALEPRWTFYDYYLMPNRWTISVGVFIMFLTTFAYVSTILGTTIVVSTGHNIAVVFDMNNFFMLLGATLFSFAALRYLDFI